MIVVSTDGYLKEHRLYVWISINLNAHCVFLPRNFGLMANGTNGLSEKNTFLDLFVIYLNFQAWGGEMVSALNSGSRGPYSGPGCGHCAVFLGKTLYSHSASLSDGTSMLSNSSLFMKQKPSKAPVWCATWLVCKLSLQYPALCQDSFLSHSHRGPWHIFPNKGW